MTATWTANATDAYSYDAGTGTGSAPAAGSGLDGTTITSTINTFSEPGYTFDSWNSGAATYTTGATYTLASNGSAIVLTATWTANATDAYSYDAGTGTGSAPAALFGPRRHHHHLGRQHLQRAGLHLRRLERRRRHLRRGGHLHLGQQRLGHRLDRHLDGQRHRRLLL